MEIKVKRWIIDKAQDTAKTYNTFIDFTRRTEDVFRAPLEEDGYVYVNAEEILGESDKAIHVRLSTGAVVGSYKGWTLWIPKSQLAPKEAI